LISAIKHEKEKTNNMKKLLTLLTSITIIVIATALLLLKNNTEEIIPEMENPLARDDWFFAQRLFPNKQIDTEAYELTRKQIIEIREEASKNKFGGEQWEFAGPVNIGGRIADVEMHSSDMTTMYVAAASGGIFKSTDSGHNWDPIFDNDYSLSIGDMAIAETDKNTIYVGTGEPNGGQGSVTYDGYGMFKSINEGLTWDHIGLENAGGIGRVEVDPQNPDRVFVAAMGNLFAKNPQRGIYRTRDGGISWDNVLYISDSTGAIDLAINFEHPDTIYAAMWERVRFVDRRTYGGPTSSLWRSFDGGNNWEELSIGLPSGSTGRIGLGISRSDPNVIYAMYCHDNGSWDDIYKSTDHGDSWTATNSNAGSSTYNWWFSKIDVDPTNPNIVYSSSFNMYKTADGANTWSRINGIHVDQHGVYIHPQNNGIVIIGNDGGVYLSTTGTTLTQFVTNLPITQFYTCEIDYQFPERLYGGTQDNGTNRTRTGNVDDWEYIYGGDGFIVRVDPSDNNFVYASSQRGGFGRSTNGGNSFSGGRSGISDNRYNWKTPYILDPNTPSTMYFGGHRVYKSTNRAQDWTMISNDLTNGSQEWNYGTITTLAVSKINRNLLYAGTDDGNVWVGSSTDGGQHFTWTKVSENLPIRWVTCVAADPFDENTAYVSFSGLRYHDYVPRIYKTTDKGQTWIDISSNLPDVPINNITVDPDNQGTFYVATDAGVFVSYDSGDIWAMMGLDLPNSPVLDLCLHSPTRTLVAATFGRSMWKIKLEPATGINDRSTEINPLLIYPNPSSDQINISFDLKSVQTGKLLIYDMNGKIMKVIYEGMFFEGNQKFVWDGTQSGNSRVAGMYICRLVTDKSIFARKIQIME
jgi:photosystem II stability/assembly factor-like uncharacterized protein